MSALEGRRKNYKLNIQESLVKKPNLFNFTSLFIACGLILLLSELFRIVISCKIVSSSMKFKFIHKISVILEKFLVFFNLLWGRIKLLQGPDPGRGLCIPVL